MKTFVYTVIIARMLLVTVQVSGRVIYVPDEYPTIQSAIYVAAIGDEVVVRDGVYEGEGFRDIRFLGRAITVRSENGSEACVIQGSGTYDDYHGFIFDHSETALSVLHGFTLKRFMSSDFQGGGAVRISNCNPTIRECNFTDNEARYGAAIQIERPTEAVNVFDSRFSNNISYLSGGAIFSEYGPIQITGCIFENNSGCWCGGAIGLRDVTGIIADCQFFSNSCDSERCLENCYGGAISGFSTSIDIVNCLLVDNVARGNSELPDSIEAQGGAIYLNNFNQTSPNKVINCTVYGNRIEVQGDGGGVYGDYDLMMRSDLLWENTDSNNHNSNVFGEYADVRYCIVQGGFPGEHNSGADPQFNFPEIDCFYLLPSSPAIDSGHAAATDVCFTGPSGEICLDELTTLADGSPDTWIVDRGYHYKNLCPFDPTVTPAPTPEPCDEIGVIVRMPANVFRPGDPCWCRVDVCNDRAEPLAGHPLFVILDVYGTLYFAPSFGDFDHYLEPFPQFDSGTTVVEVLREFSWPGSTGAASDLHWYAALTDPGMTRIFGEWDTFTFGWTDVP